MQKHHKCSSQYLAISPDMTPTTKAVVYLDEENNKSNSWIENRRMEQILKLKCPRKQLKR